MRAALPALLLIGCAKGAPRSPDPLTTGHMVGLTDAANAARLAVVAGKPELAVGYLGWLAESLDPREVDRVLQPHAQRLVEHAAAGAESADLAEVALATARVGESCGRCHTAVGTSPRFAEAELAAGDDIVAHMARHQWGVDSLWEGLVMPHDGKWRAGARSFFEMPVDPDYEPSLDPELAGVADQVHSIGTDALAMVDPSSRAAIYAELVTACGTCHAAMWVPPPDYLGFDLPVVE